MSRFESIDCIYEPASGEIHYVAVVDGEDDRIVSEAEALTILGAGPYAGDAIARRKLAQARRVQAPAIVSTDRARFTLVPSDEYPILLDGEPYVPGVAR